MEKDRRSAPRVRVKLAARWEGVLTHDTATITDLSRNGCFVLTGGKVTQKELIWVEIDLPNPPPIHFWAEVIEIADEIGFAVRFNTGAEVDKERLAKFIESVFESPGKPS
jgi:hypothetical protein